MSHPWAHEAVFYHVYPLGMCGAPAANDFCSPMAPRLEQLYDWIGYWKEIGVNALYLGSIFESSRHGYDTVDYFWVDRRLGNNELFKNLVAKLHENGIRIILDGVFNHVGRDFWAFKDVLNKGPESPYCSWFAGLRFGERSPSAIPSPTKLGMGPLTS
jgi:glycosidase